MYLEKAEIIRDKVRTRGLKLHLFTEGNSATRVLLEPKKHNLLKEVCILKYIIKKIMIITIIKLMNYLFMLIRYGLEITVKMF